MDSSTTHPLKRIIILGANGQLGSVLHQYLSIQFPDAEIIGCIRNVEPISGSYIKFNPFTDDWQKLGKADVLINCIGIIKETPQTTFTKAHEVMTQLILKNRALLGNPRIIQISALGADIHSPALFLHTKGKADQLLLSQPDTVVVRPSIVCTFNTMVVRKLRLLHQISRFLLGYLPFPSTLLNTRIQPILPDDLAAIVAQGCRLQNPPVLIHAVGPSPLSLQQLIELFPNKKVHLVKLSKRVSDIAAGLVTRLFPRLLTKDKYLLLQKDNTYSAAEAQNILGRKLQSTEAFWQKAIDDCR